MHFQKKNRDKSSVGVGDSESFFLTKRYQKQWEETITVQSSITFAGSYCNVKVGRCVYTTH